MKTLLISIMFGMLLSGCANMVKTDSQDIVIETNSRLPHIITCNVINEEGSWEFEATHIGTIHRDGNTMEIKCTNGIEEGGGYVHPSFSGAYFAYRFFGTSSIATCSSSYLPNFSFTKSFLISLGYVNSESNEGVSNPVIITPFIFSGGYVPGTLTTILFLFTSVKKFQIAGTLLKRELIIFFEKTSVRKKS